MQDIQSEMTIECCRTRRKHWGSCVMAGTLTGMGGGGKRRREEIVVV